MWGTDHATLKSFYGFFTEGNDGANRFRVAHFQRPYVWPERFVWQLLEDIWELYRNKKPSKPIGCVITSDSGGVHDIVDGQQRLITLTLIHRAIVYWCRRHEAGDMPYFVANLFDATSPDLLFKTRDLSMRYKRCWTPRLNLFDVDENTWFHKVFLCHPDDTDEHINNMLVSQDVPQHRLPFLNNFKTVLSFLADRKGGDCRGSLSAKGNPLSFDEEVFQGAVRGRTEGDDPASCQGFYMDRQFEHNSNDLDGMEDLDSFCRNIAQNTKIVHFVTFDPGMAVDIFNALNRPGLPLTISHRLKASLLANIDYPTVASVSSVWNEAERKLMALMSWDEDPLAPFLECLIEITPKPPSRVIFDFFYENPTCAGKFTDTHRLNLLDKFQDFHVEIRSRPPPAPPDQRLRLYTKDGQPNPDAVAIFVETYLDGQLVPLYISLLSLADQNSWGSGPEPSDADEPETEFNKVQNCISILKHVHRLDLDRDWICPVLLASHIWGLATVPVCTPDIVLAFFERFEVFVAYLVCCRPTDRPRNKDAPVLSARAWTLREKSAREDRVAYYRELLDKIYRSKPADVVEWLDLGRGEQALAHRMLSASKNIFSGDVDEDLRHRVQIYMSLRTTLHDSPKAMMRCFDSIARELLEQPKSPSVEKYLQIVEQTFLSAGRMVAPIAKTPVAKVRAPLPRDPATLTAGTPLPPVAKTTMPPLPRDPATLTTGIPLAPVAPVAKTAQVRPPLAQDRTTIIAGRVPTPMAKAPMAKVWSPLPTGIAGEAPPRMETWEHDDTELDRIIKDDQLKPHSKRQKLDDDCGGHVKDLKPFRRFGFIVCTSPASMMHRSFFFHFSELVTSQVIRIHDQVLFKIGQDRQGRWQAKSVRRLSRE